MSSRSPSEVALLQVSAEAARAISEGNAPPGLSVPEDYPSEFSAGVAESVGRDGTVGPFFIRRTVDGLVVGEIGGAFVESGTVEIGYAIVDSQSGNGYATGAVVEFIALAQSELPDAERIVAHTPPDRPSSSRVLAKAGFSSRGQVEDEHEGESITVEEWELALS